MRSLLRSPWLSLDGIDDPEQEQYFVGRVREVDWAGTRIARSATADEIARLKADQ